MPTMNELLDSCPATVTDEEGVLGTPGATVDFRTLLEAMELCKHEVTGYDTDNCEPITATETVPVNSTTCFLTTGSAQCNPDGSATIGDLRIAPRYERYGVTASGGAWNVEPTDAAGTIITTHTFTVDVPCDTTAVVTGSWSINQLAAGGQLQMRTFWTVNGGPPRIDIGGQDFYEFVPTPNNEQEFSITGPLNGLELEKGTNTIEFYFEVNANSIDDTVTNNAYGFGIYVLEFCCD